MFGKKIVIFGLSVLMVAGPALNGLALAPGTALREKKFQKAYSEAGSAGGVAAFQAGTLRVLGGVSEGALPENVASAIESSGRKSPKSEDVVLDFEKSIKPVWKSALDMSYSLFTEAIGEEFEYDSEQTLANIRVLEVMGGRGAYRSGGMVYVTRTDLNALNEAQKMDKDVYEGAKIYTGVHLVAHEQAHVFFKLIERDDIRVRKLMKFLGLNLPEFKFSKLLPSDQRIWEEAIVLAIAERVQSKIGGNNKESQKKISAYLNAAKQSAGDKGFKVADVVIGSHHVRGIFRGRVVANLRAGKSVNLLDTLRVMIDAMLKEAEDDKAGGLDYDEVFNILEKIDEKYGPYFDEQENKSIESSTKDIEQSNIDDSNRTKYLKQGDKNYILKEDYVGWIKFITGKTIFPLFNNVKMKDSDREFFEATLELVLSKLKPADITEELVPDVIAVFDFFITACKNNPGLVDEKFLENILKTPSPWLINDKVVSSLVELLSVVSERLVDKQLRNVFEFIRKNDLASNFPSVSPPMFYLFKVMLSNKLISKELAEKINIFALTFATDFLNGKHDVKLEATYRDVLSTKDIVSDEMKYRYGDILLLKLDVISALRKLPKGNNMASQLTKEMLSMLDKCITLAGNLIDEEKQAEAEGLHFALMTLLPQMFFRRYK